MLLLHSTSLLRSQSFRWWAPSSWETSHWWSLIPEPVSLSSNGLGCSIIVACQRKISTTFNVMVLWQKRFWRKVNPIWHCSQVHPQLESVSCGNWTEKLSLKMEDMTGRFWDLMFQRARARLIMSLGNVITMLMVLLDKSVPPSQFASCTETGGRLTSSRNSQHRLAEETWRTSLLDQLSLGTMLV